MGRVTRFRPRASKGRRSDRKRAGAGLSRSETVWLGIAVALLGSAGVGYVAVHEPSAAFSPAAFGLMPGCDIKGNVSIDTGERIYHVLGQKFYSQTRISPEYGERWFCSEDEARAAGWRRARQ